MIAVHLSAEAWHSPGPDAARSSLDYLLFLAFFAARFSLALILAFFCCSRLPLSLLPLSPITHQHTQAGVTDHRLHLSRLRGISELERSLCEGQGIC